MAACAPAVRGHFAKVLRGSHDAEDASQHVLLRVLEGLPRYRREAAPFGAWVFAIARNHAIDRARVSNRTEPVAPAEIAATVDALGEVEAGESVTEQRSAILELIEPLPAPQRRVIELLYVRDLSHRDAARVLGRTERPCGSSTSGHGTTCAD